MTQPMLYRPLSKEAAQHHIYGIYANNPIGQKYNESLCAAEVKDFSGSDCGYGNIYRFTRQCSRKNGYGLNKLYCKCHAKMVGNI